MKMKVKFFAKVLIILLLTTVIFSAYSYVIRPKYVYGQGFPTTSTYMGFYEQKKDSIDTLMLGSSHGVCAFNPQLIKEEYGISSYNLSCEQQNLFTSYYWLKEAVKYQKPDTLFLESYMLFLFENEELSATTANCTHKAFDFMRLSTHKLKAATEANRIDGDLNFSNMLFANVMYHSRWKEVTVKDFKLSYSDDPGFLSGFYPLEGYGVTGFEPIDGSGLGENDNNSLKPNGIMLEYLDRIVALCEKENIKLILVSTPTAFETPKEHAYLVQYAQNNSIDFVDFNEANTYKEAGYDFFNDNNDDDHANEKGAAKISRYLAEHYLK